MIESIADASYTNSRKELRRCCSPIGTIIQSIFCAQSGASIHLTVWKWSGESRYPGALPPELENFRRAFSSSSTDCTWVSEDGHTTTCDAVFVPGEVLPYKGLMGTCGQRGYVFRDFCLKQGIDFIIFVLNRVSILSFLS